MRQQPPRGRAGPYAARRVSERVFCRQVARFLVGRRRRRYGRNRMILYDDSGCGLHCIHAIQMMTLMYAHVLRSYSCNVYSRFVAPSFSYHYTPISRLHYDTRGLGLPVQQREVQMIGYFLIFLPFPPLSSSRPRFLLVPELAESLARASFKMPCKIRFSPSRTTTACLLFNESCSTASGASSFSSS